MRVLYVAKHGSGGNDDEGAVAFALEQLGCEVVRVPEQPPRRRYAWPPADFMLCHHWRDGAVEALRQIRVPKVCWCFDLIDYPDETLARRCSERTVWIGSMTALCDLVFMSDGDWVAGDGSEKLVWLPQGADERVVGAGFPDPALACDVLFTGGRNGGRGRESFVDEMRAKYGDRFRHVEKGVHGRRLADLIASSKIVVAPDHPVTDRYCSNRATLTLGFGGFLLHPKCEALSRQFVDREDIVFYQDRNDLHSQIDFYLRHPDLRAEVAAGGLLRTLGGHTYRHRCAELLRVVKERLGVG